MQTNIALNFYMRAASAENDSEFGSLKGVVRRCPAGAHFNGNGILLNGLFHVLAGLIAACTLFQFDQFVPFALIEHAVLVNIPRRPNTNPLRVKGIDQIYDVLYMCLCCVLCDS